jgi:acyl-CoA reductase-like NAD-dependent aldehyde dehydrogenase
MTVTMPSAAGSGYAGREVWGAFIDGAFADTADAPTFPVMEPATGRQLARVVSGDSDLADRAVAAARRAFGPWRDTPPRERGRLLRQVAAKIRAHVDELAELEAREVGKPRRDALRFDLSYCHAGYDYYAGLAETLHGEILDQGPIEARVIYEPYGVVAAILPFNWPPIHFTKKCAPALAAGNTVVVKPGEQAPLTVLRLVELANEVLPPGVLNAVPGMAAGPALSAHPRVERITFTGSPAPRSGWSSAMAWTPPPTSGRWSTRPSATRCWPTCGPDSMRGPAWSLRAGCRPTSGSRTGTGSRRRCWPTSRRT